ncbi:unnamed protein product [Trichobilharzia regenti]|nr:unnamed protein product [Trichobilharzia regenti]
MGLIYSSDLEQILNLSEYRSFPDVHLNLCRKWRHLKVGKSTLTTSSSSSSAVEQQDNNKLNRLAENDLIDSNNNNNNNNNKNNNKADNKTAQSKEEEWLCHYMLAKCAEKDAYLIKQSEDVYPSSRLMHVLRLYHDALKALDSAGAKYPKKIIFYNKIPFRAVEAIEARLAYIYGMPTNLRHFRRRHEISGWLSTKGGGCTPQQFAPSSFMIVSETLSH